MKDAVFVKPGDPILNKRAVEVEPKDINSKEIQDIVSKMLEIASGEQGNPEVPTMVGLAAPQIGINKRIIIVDTKGSGRGEEPEFIVLINPKIVESSNELVEGREGCYSTSNACGIVARSKEIEVEGYDANADKISQMFKDFTARVVQHEIDHLDGIRFPDRITDDSKLHWVERDKFGQYRENWHTWKELCTRSKWEAIKAEN